MTELSRGVQSVQGGTAPDARYWRTSRSGRWGPLRPAPERLGGAPPTGRNQINAPAKTAKPSTVRKLSNQGTATDPRRR